MTRTVILQGSKVRIRHELSIVCLESTVDLMVLYDLTTFLAASRRPVTSS